ncbi:MAG TPA: CHASE3 domain-containing protein [Burkholderiaceae bacterium]|nr:CHASE3 domain-containing protein [Burkholderiaceae bacterium]
MASFSDTVGRSFARTRQGVLLGACFVILIAIAGAVTLLVEQASRDAQIVAHTLRVQDTLSNILLSVRRAESGQRGHLFTNRRDYLDDFEAAQPEVRQALAELSALTTDNPKRVADVENIQKLVDAKFAELTRSIDLNASGQREQARAFVLGGEGRDLMNEIRRVVESATADESRLLSERTERTQRNNRLLLIVSVLGAVLILLIGGLSIYLVQRNYRAAAGARSELEATNQNLERIVEYRTADLKEANEEIQRFAYIVSHDLRSPLVNIMGFTTELEALRKDLFERLTELHLQIVALSAQIAQASAPAPSEGQRPAEELGRDFDEAIGFIKTSINKMDRLINAVLKLSREGRREFHPETIDMQVMMDSVVRTVAHRATELGATVTVSELPTVESDRLALEQIFSNLVDNAMKYLRDGVPGQVEISGRSTGVQVIYDVTDNGRGIDERDHQRVFELFRRAGAQDRPGEGIGLAHVRALVRRLGGHMGLKSELGKGSTFTVTLPRRWSAQVRSVA